MSEPQKEIIKLTEKDIPELAPKENATEGTCCCYYKKDWAGYWEKMYCTDIHSTESECSSKRPHEAEAYSWSPYSC